MLPGMLRELRSLRTLPPFPASRYAELVSGGPLPLLEARELTLPGSMWLPD